MRSSRRAAIAGFAVILIAGLCVLTAAAIKTESPVTASVGVLPVYPVAPLPAGQEACQAPIALADPLERVRFHIGTFGKPGPQLEITVRSAGGALVLGQARIPGGWVDDGSPKDAAVGRVAAEQSVSACVRNAGRNTAYVYGDISTGVFGTGPLGVRPTITTSAATIDDVDIPGDIAVEFTTAQSHSLLGRLPDAFAHAAVFRPEGVGPWTYWLLAALVVVGAPLALLLALVRAEDSDRRLPSTPDR
jgi:hypothetical protein